MTYVTFRLKGSVFAVRVTLTPRPGVPAYAYAISAIRQACDRLGGVSPSQLELI